MQYFSFVYAVYKRILDDGTLGCLGGGIMTDINKQNLVYFEANSMKQLYDDMEEWQNHWEKRFLSTQIQRDAEKLCCIALTAPTIPTEVVICSASGDEKASVRDRRLCTNPPTMTKHIR